MSQRPLNKIGVMLNKGLDLWFPNKRQQKAMEAATRQVQRKWNKAERERRNVLVDPVVVEVHSITELHEIRQGVIRDQEDDPEYAPKKG